jgi:fumarate reductase flavoprotein subunit
MHTPDAGTQHEFDVIIVGAGTAGIPVALEAADRGARVVLLEKLADVGGMLHATSGQISAGGTRRQQSQGIVDSPRQHFEDALRLAHHKSNAPLVELSVEAQREMVDWLESLGFEFHPDAPSLYYGHELYSIPRTHYGRTREELLRILRPQLMRRVEDETIDLRLETRMREFMAAEDGGVNGVLAVRATGDAYTLRAYSVVLATGGYGANRDLVARLLPTPYQCAITGCLAHATGDGLLAAQQLGAAITDYGYFIPRMGLIPDPDRPGFALPFNEARLELVAAERQSNEIWVNLGGERFVAEDNGSPEARERALMRQAELKMAVIWDARAVRAATPVIGPRELWTQERVVREAEHGRFVWRADSLPALADRLGVETNVLLATVDRYNRAVDAQYDPEFGRTVLPARIEEKPFFGLISQGGMLMTREGLCVDSEMRVLGRGGAPIAGLYAVGEVLGASQFMGDNVVGGMSLGPALALGRLLGQRLGDASAARRAVVSSAS